jgi:hypothetical protein
LKGAIGNMFTMRWAFELFHNFKILTLSGALIEQAAKFWSFSVVISGEELLAQCLFICCKQQHSLDV